MRVKLEAVGRAVSLIITKGLLISGKVSVGNLSHTTLYDNAPRYDPTTYVGVKKDPRTCLTRLFFGPVIRVNDTPLGHIKRDKNVECKVPIFGHAEYRLCFYTRFEQGSLFCHTFATLLLRPPYRVKNVGHF